MAIKLGTQTTGVMLVTGNGDLSAIALLDTNPISPVSRLWSISYWPDNLTSAPTVASATSNPASFTPPAAGEWYIVRLVRTLLVGTETLELPICVPDATGTYALPPPGVPADTDPTKTIVNLNDDAKIVGWAGGKRASLPGLSAGVRKAIADAAAAATQAAAAFAGLQHIDFDAHAVGDGTTDDTPAWDACMALLSGGGTLRMGPRTYAALTVWNIPHDNIIVDAHINATKVQAKAANTSANVITATGRTNVHINGLTVDVNSGARSGSPLNGILFSSCIDSDTTWCLVQNALGPSGFAIALAGGGVRCMALGCRVKNSGPNATTDVADGIFTSGEQNLIVGCIAEDCYDHGFVIESSNYSGISGCTALRCGAGAGISATAADKIGNYIDGLTVGQWYATVTGGVDILCTGNGNLLNTRITGLTMSEAQPGATVAVYLRRADALGNLPSGTINGVEISSFLIDGADTYGIAMSDGCTNIRIGQGRVNANNGIILGDRAVGCTFVFLSDVVISTQGANAFYARTSSDTVQLRDVHIIGKSGTTTVGATFETGCTNILDGGVTGTDCSSAVIAGTGSTTISRMWVDLTNAQTIAGAKTWSDPAVFSSTARVSGKVGFNQATSNAEVAITSPGSNTLAISMLGSSNAVGAGFGANGEFGGLSHDVPTASGVVRMGASVRGELGLTSGNYPWTFTPALYFRLNAGGSIGAVGIGVDPSAKHTRLLLPATTTTDSPIQWTSGTAKTSPEDGDVELTSVGFLATYGGTRYGIPVTFGTTATTINIPTTALTTGQTVTNTGTVTGAAVGDHVMVNPASGTASDNGTVVDAWVSAANTVTVRVTCVAASVTTNGINYNVRVVKKP